MHTPEGTLERGQAPPFYSAPIHRQPSLNNDEITIPHLLSLPNKDECNNLTSVLRIQDQLKNLSLHKSSSEPAMVGINIPDSCLCPDSSPDTPQPAYDPKQGWINGIFGCLRPVLSIIGKGPGIEIKNNQDDWEIPFEQITDLNFLGCGGQAMVFSGILNNEPVAVKKVQELKETDIKHLRKLNHPNIVKFKGVCIQPPCFSIVMEFCPYGPLFNLLKNQKNVVTINRVVSWVKQIANGMHYLHSQKIIHRDLKSPNVLIGEEEVIKISDFGTSRSWNGISEKMSFAGTVAWMAPEALQERECSEKVDIWSFGVVLWELLTCEIPYNGLETNAILYMVGSGKLKPPIPKTCPDGFKLIMEMCWKFNPKERPSFKLILNHLQIASAEILGKYDDKQFFETQETWKEDIKSQITQFQIKLKKKRREFLMKEEQLVKKRETELKHVKDIRELYERKLERTNQLYLELLTYLQQQGGQQGRQGGRKRDMQYKRRLINPFMRKLDKRRCNNNNSTTPTSPEHSLTSPDSPQAIPNKAPLYAKLTDKSDSATQITQQTSTSTLTTTKFRKRHSRTNSGSPRNSGCSKSSSCRTSIVVDAETQTESMDISENDMSPTTICSINSFPNKTTRQRVILHEIRNESDDEEGINGNCVQLHYMVQRENPTVQIFTKMESRSPSPNLYDTDDNLNKNDKRTEISDEDNLETINKKFSAIKNGNIFSEIRLSENGNITDDLVEVIRQTCVKNRNCLDSTEDACNDSFTDEEGKTYNNYVLRRRSLARRPIRRSSRYKYNYSNYQCEPNVSDEGNTSEYSISPSSKSSTLESNPDRNCGLIVNSTSLKRPPNEQSDSSSDSETEENLTIVTQVSYNINKPESVV